MPIVSSTLFEGLDELDDLFSVHEVKRALFGINSYKKPGPDVVQARFFKYGWTLIQGPLLQFANQVCTNPNDIKDVNKTFVSLISKKDLGEVVADFRPISLCNIVYKIISKLIVNHIKPFLDYFQFCPCKEYC